MENKEILLKELGSRLSHDVKLSYKYKNHIHILSGMTRSGMVVINDTVTDEITTTDIENVKPYLFPLSSMTEEQRWKAQNLLPDNCEISFTNSKIEFYGEDYHKIKLEQFENLFNLFNMWYLDYRGLIPMGLAIDATGKNIY
jgi:hypothetical protein